MARPERFELPTARFVAEYSIQLSYGRFVRFGSGLKAGRDRSIMVLARCAEVKPYSAAKRSLFRQHEELQLFEFPAKRYSLRSRLLIEALHPATCLSHVVIVALTPQRQ